MTAQEFVNNYIATHDGATVQDANRVYSEAVRLNQTGMKFPAARKQESTAARSSVSPSSRKSRSEGKRTTAGKTASEGAVRADRSPSRVQRWTASYASALLKGSKIQGIDIAFDGFGDGERGYYLLDKVNIPARRAKDAPALFSGGMQQRVQIAKALSNNPPILLLDEVTTGLDLSVQASVLDLILRIRRDFNVSMLVVSHDLGVIRMLADRTFVMLDGQVIEHGLTDQILEDPQHAYTQQLVYSLL